MCKTLNNRAKTIFEVSNIGCSELEHLRSILKMNGNEWLWKFIWNETTILAMDNRKFSRKRREEIESIVR